MKIDAPDYTLKAEFRVYRSARSKRFYLAPGHKIADCIKFGLGRSNAQCAWDRPLKTLALVFGTGGIKKDLASLGHYVTALDFAEAMFRVSMAKYRSGCNVGLLASDAQYTIEPDATYDAINCRQCVWTLTEPQKAFQRMPPCPQVVRQTAGLRWQPVGAEFNRKGRITSNPHNRAI